MAKQDTNDRKFEKKLPVQLTDDEKMQKGVRLARLLDEIEDKKDDKKDIGKEIKKLDEKAKALKGHLTSGVEERMVEVKEVCDWKTKRVTLTRLDTGETIEDRAMKAEEVQKPLNLREGQSKAGAGKGKGKDGDGKTPPAKPTLVKGGKDGAKK